MSLSCEERKKEIAIRKVNGAGVRDILSIFIKEYFLLLLIGGLIAFPIGYIIMKQWIENYTLQTTIPFWIYIMILLAFALIIICSIGWRVYRSSIENPAEVLKSE
ncbi:MAG: FtsX-like permease family protein [Bacteroidales bacterium]|nr:FtsX-like permease family protein [Bacteroidales bacterium]